MKIPKIPYPGAKGRLAPILVSMMPKGGRTYVEPFAGRGNVFFAAALALKFSVWRINDIATAPFFAALKERGGRIRVPRRTRGEFVRQKRLFEEGSPRARLLEPYLTFSGGGYRKGGFGGKRSASAAGYTKTLNLCSEILARTDPLITGDDWKSLGLKSLGDQDFVFLDPPYF